jgi:putative Holliday junction resolvase
MSESGVIVGFDVGTKRVGAAFGDIETGIARPVKAIVHDDDIFKNIDELLKEENAETIVVGLPRSSEGEETEQSAFSRAFASELGKRFSSGDVPAIVFQDESLTSMMAEERLRQRKDFQETMLRDGTLDSEAAVMIVEDYLEEQRG